jgi:hypothetical protein
MRWSSRSNVGRPDYPKLIPVAADFGGTSNLLSVIREHDPEATILDGDECSFLKVHNDAAERAVRAARPTSISIRVRSLP